MINKRYLMLMGIFSLFSMNNMLGMENVDSEREEIKLHYKILAVQEKQFDDRKELVKYIGAIGKRQLIIDTVNGQEEKSSRLNNSFSVIVGDDFEKQKKAVEFAKSLTILVSDKVLNFVKEYIELKKDNPVFKDMTLKKYVHRIFNKRMLVCTDRQDHVVTREGKVLHDKVQFIGINKNQKILEELKEDDYMSYDDLLISAFFGHASKTFFINDGDRYNNMKIGDVGTYQPEGALVGLVGPRFEKSGFMEWQHMVISEEQNTKENGYGKEGTINNPLLQLCAKLYGVDYFPAYDEIDENNPNYFKTKKDDKDVYLNIPIYKKRLHSIIEQFLQYANKMGEEEKKKVYVYAVGIGLGYWSLDNEVQVKLMLDVYNEIIQQNNFEHISDINFGWFPEMYQMCGETKNGEILKGIKIIFSKRNPSAPLIGEDKDKYLVAMYAWDSNAFVGNEYWKGQLDTSGDASAAASSVAPTVQNPLINPFYNKNAKRKVKESEKNMLDNTDKKDKENDEKKEKLNQYTEEDLSTVRAWWLSQESVIKYVKDARAANKYKTLKLNGCTGVDYIIINLEKQTISTFIKGKEITLSYKEFDLLLNEDITKKALKKYNAELSKIGQEDKDQTLQSGEQNKKPFFTTNTKLRIASITLFVGVLMWLWQNNYFKHFGTPSFAFR